jgi:hypothetical protein
VLNRNIRLHLPVPLPLREDGKVWSGRATFAASKPIEVEVLHMHNPNGNIGQIHGEPYHATLPGNKTIAISHLRNVVDVRIELTVLVRVLEHLNLLVALLYFIKQQENHLQSPILSTQKLSH